MKIVFRSQELWDLMEKDMAEYKDKAQEKENKKCDAKALYFIQQAIDDQILDCIADAKIAHEAWEIFRK